MTGQFVFERGRLAQQIRYIAPKLPHLTKPKKTRSRRTARKFDTTFPPMIDVVFFTGDPMPDEPKPEGAPAGPEKPAEGEKPRRLPKPADPAAAKPAAPAAAKPAAPAAKPPRRARRPQASGPHGRHAVGKRAHRPVCEEHFGDQITEFSTYLGQNFLVAKSAAVVPILEFLKLEEDFDYLVDLTAVDYPKRAERFDLVYILYSFARNERIRIKTIVAEGARPATAVGVHLTANWLEREVFDMFGIQFEGHPDMRRILMPEEWEGHPLRKDYSILQQDDRWVQENLGIESGQ